MTTLGATLSSVTYPADDQTITSRMVALTSATADVMTSQSTTSTSFTNLATSGPAITLVPGVIQDYILLTRCWQSRNTVGDHYHSVSIAGAAAADNDAGYDSSAALCSVASHILALAHANNIADTMKYRVGGSTGNWQSRRLAGAAI